MTPTDPAPVVGEEWETRVKRGKLPTPKLVSAAVTMAVLYALRQFVDVDEELENIVNLGVPLIVAYFWKNPGTPGGVPDAEVVSEPVIKPAGWGHGA